MQTGTITRIIGPVVDVDFSAQGGSASGRGDLPDIYTALEVAKGDKKLVLETEQHLGGGMVRAVAMDTTDGLSRGMKVINTGAPISVPVGASTLGRLFNVLGEVIDDLPRVDTQVKVGGKEMRLPIHRLAPALP